MDDEAAIRGRIERWAAAAHEGDLDMVLADHAATSSCSTCRRPRTGARGIEAYRETWPPFFTWQARGARFDLVSLEVTAGEDVTFAHVRLRCGMSDDLEANPDRRLRLTVGLREDDGRWVAAHEHHSFPDRS